MQFKKRILTETQPCWPPELRRPASRNVRIKPLLFILRVWALRESRQSGLRQELLQGAAQIQPRRLLEGLPPARSSSQERGQSSQSCGVIPAALPAPVPPVKTHLSPDPPSGLRPHRLQLRPAGPCPQPPAGSPGLGQTHSGLWLDQ